MIRMVCGLCLGYFFFRVGELWSLLSLFTLGGSFCLVPSWSRQIDEHRAGRDREPSTDIFIFSEWHGMACQAGRNETEGCAARVSSTPALSLPCFRPSDPLFSFCPSSLSHFFIFILPLLSPRSFFLSPFVKA